MPVTKLPAKEVLKEQLVQALAAALHSAKAAYQAALEGATHEQAKAENDKDTRALEQSYLARGTALRITELEEHLAQTSSLAISSWKSERPIGMGALVMVMENHVEHAFFVAPHGGGILLADGKVQTVTPQSPLGRALLGKQIGDDCEVPLAGKKREFVIEDIR